MVSLLHVLHAVLCPPCICIIAPDYWPLIIQHGTEYAADTVPGTQWPVWTHWITACMDTVQKLFKVLVVITPSCMIHVKRYERIAHITILCVAEAAATQQL